MPVAGPRIASAMFYASFLFDVADTIDLTKLGSISGEAAAPAPLRFRAATTPENIQFAVPPLAANLPAVTFDGVSATARAKFYDYGVVSIRFTVPYAGDWSGFIDLVIALRAGDRLLGAARTLLDGILVDCSAALVDPHETLVEDYFSAAIERLDVPVDAAALLANYGAAIVGLISAEHQPLSPEEQAETLRLRFSYLPDDLVVVQWDSAFIYDSRENAQVIVDLLDFANSQLVEFRTYDDQLDKELEAIYPAEVAQPPRWNALRRRQTEDRAQQLRYLLVDIRELTDRASNALKIVGDAFYARIYRAIAQRLGLDVWQRQIESKLDAVGDVYRYLTDQAQTARGEFLELIVILLIGVEIVVGILGLRH
jgi:hypothetical protein